MNGNSLKKVSISDCDIEEACFLEPMITQLHLADNDFDEIPNIAFELPKLTFLGRLNFKIM